MKVKTGDTVRILAGKDKGKTGKVLRVFTKKNQVLVEGVNKYKRHVKKQSDRPGGVVEIERPLHASNVKQINSKK